MNPIKKRVKALRVEMKAVGLDAYVVPSTDPHQSEYTPAHWQRRQWLSGFTGSVGDLVITADQAFLWTDSRYFLQAEEQIESTPFRLMRQGNPEVPSLRAWLSTTLPAGHVVGIDPGLVTLREHDEIAAALGSSGVKLKLLKKNLVDAIWPDRPPLPQTPVVRHKKRYSGDDEDSKITWLRQEMEKSEADAYVITRLDCVAWLYNLRGADVSFTPVSVAYGLVTRDRAFLFVEESKVSQRLRDELAPLIEIRPYNALDAELKRLGRSKQRVWVDPVSVTASIGRALRGAKLVRKASPIPAAKARKNKTEIKGARAVHERDGVALVRLHAWLEASLATGAKVTELGVSAKLEEFRSELPLYQGPSFNTISAFGSHGAIVHYAPSPKSDRRLRRGGLFLLDAGGQYLDGTTDMTRTVYLGGKGCEKKPTAEMKDRFTRVLKGHIALARTRFPAGVSGQRLDAFARRSLWEAGLDYGHGTGHGVGSYLSVHEAPPSVAPARMPTVPLEEGHIFSNEPGYYKTGRYGIRTENLVLVKRDRELSKREHAFYCFETLTLCPIDIELIDLKILDGEERRWINEYHAKVYKVLKPHLSRDEAKWLRGRTKKI